MSLDDGERAMPELAVHAASRLMALQGDATLARLWLLPVWDNMLAQNSDLGDKLRIKLITTLETGLDSLDGTWLARIESAQISRPRDAKLQYLAGMACLSRQLWGKAQQLLSKAFFLIAWSHKQSANLIFSYRNCANAFFSRKQ